MRCVLPWLDSWAAKKPDAAAFEDEKTCLTWRQLHDTAKRIGTYLARQLPPRVPVALCMDKSPNCRGDARRAGSWVLLYHH